MYPHTSPVYFCHFFRDVANFPALQVRDDALILYLSTKFWAVSCFFQEIVVNVCAQFGFPGTKFIMQQCRWRNLVYCKTYRICSR